jgi:hypothetical protein
MSDFHQLAQDYIDAWNEQDTGKRAARAGEIFAAGVCYIDPLIEVTGTPALVEAIGAVQQQFSGWVFRLTGAVDGHHEQLRFSWELGPHDGAAPVAGFDVAALDDDGRIRQLYGFLDRVPG